MNPSASGLNLFDLGVIAVLLVSALIAFGRGFVREVLSIAAWVAAAVATYFGFPLVLPLVQKHIDVPLIAQVVTGAAIFIVTLILATAVSSVLTRNVRTSAFGAVDRSLGLLFGLARGAVLVCLFYLIMTQTFWASVDERPAWVTGARGLPLIEAGTQLLRRALPREAVTQGTAAVQSTRQKVEQAIDAGSTAQGLAQQPAPAANPPGATDGSGYKQDERRDLDRLIRGSQP